MAAISITATSVLPGSTASLTTVTIAAGVTITQGQAVTKDASGNLILADANGVAPANAFFGIAMSGGSPGQPCVVNTGDPAYTVGGTVAPGPIYVHTTPGALTLAFADLTSGSTVIVIGMATSTTLATIQSSPTISSFPGTT